MTNTREPGCECRKDLDLAAAGLAQASRLLADAVALNSEEMIEAYYAAVRRAKARVYGALSDYRDQMRERGLGPESTG